MHLCRYSEKVHVHVQQHKIDNDTSYFQCITAMKIIFLFLYCMY